jgi:hypothetical protein
MIRDVKNFAFYSQIKSQYEGMEGYDDNKIAKEAVARVIADVIMQDEPSGEYRDSQIEKAKSWWQRIFDWLKSKLRKIEPGAYARDLDEFRLSAQIIQENRSEGLKTVQDVRNKYVKDPYYSQYYHLSEEHKDEQKRLVELFNNLRVIRNPNGKGYIHLDGRPVRHRVTDLVKQYYRKIFGDEPNDKILAMKGTLLHKLNQKLMNRLEEGRSIDSTSYTDNQLLKETADELSREDPDFRDLTPIFYDITGGQLQQLRTGVKAIYDHIQKTQDRINKLTQTSGKAEIFTELMIYDEEADRAGTIDLIVVYSNGTVGFFDYKGIKMFEARGKAVGSLPQYKLDAYDIQMVGYKNILQSSYGVKNFAESRVVPINMQFNQNVYAGFRKLEMGQGINEDKEYLDHIPLAKEMTADEDLNQTLNKMFALRERLNNRKQSSKYDERLEIRINQLSKAIRRVQIAQDINYVIDEINRINQEFTERVNHPADNADALSFKDLVEFYEYLNVFENLVSDAENSVKDDKELSDRLDKIGTARQRLMKRIYDKIAELGSKEGYDLDQASPEVGVMGKLFKQLSEFSRPAFQFMSRMVRMNEEAVRQDLDAMIEKIEKADDKLSAWAKSKSMSLQDAYDKLYNAKTGNLIAKFNTKFSESKKQAAGERKFAWFIENTRVLRDETTKSGIQLEPDMRSKFEKNKTKFFEYIDRKYKGDNYSKQREKIKQEYLAKYDVSTSLDALFNSKNYYVRPKENEANLSEEFKYLKQAGNEPLLEYYEMYVEANLEFAAITGKDINHNFVANIHQDLIDRVAQNGALHAGGLRKYLKHAFEVRQNDVLHGNVKKDPSTGEMLYNIPLLYRDRLTDKLSSSEIEEVRAEVEKKYGGTPEFNDEFQKALQFAREKKGLEFKNRDLSRSLILFAETAYTYKYYSETEDAIRATYEYLKHRGSTELTDSMGNKLVDSVTGEVMRTHNIPAEELDAFDKFIKRYWYGKKVAGKDLTFTIKEKRDKDGNIIREARTYSGHKLARAVMSYVATKSLAFKPILAAGNMIGIKSNQYMIAAEGLYYTRKEMKAAHRLYMTRDPKRAAAIAFFEPYAHDLSREKANKHSANRLSRTITSDNLLFMHKTADQSVDGNNLISLTHSYGLDENGKIKHLRDLPEGSKSIWERSSYNESTGEFAVEGMSQEAFVHFKTLTRRIATKIKGQIPQDDKSLFDATLAGAMLMMYRSWIPGLVKTRFSKLTYDPILGTFDAGRFSVVFSEILSDAVEPRFNRFMKVLGSSIGLYKPNPNMEIAERLYKEFLSTNPQYTKENLSLEEFIEMRKAKLRGMAMELRLLLSFVALALGAKAAIPDEDEYGRFTHQAVVNLYRALNKGLLELSFFFSPSSVTQILRTPVPAFSVFTDLQELIKNTIDETRDLVFGENAHTDNTPFGYYTLKYVPVITSAIDFIDLFGTYDVTSGY